jgi:hypothetical protein
MQSFTPAEYDAALEHAVEDMPEAILAALGDGVIRVQQAPRAGALETVPGLRLVVYREPSISQARDLAELRRLARADLVRALVWELDLGDDHAHDLGIGRDAVAF